MTLIHNLIFLIFAILLNSDVFCLNVNDDLLKAHGVTKVEHLAHKHQPTFAPCKYGVVMAFDQPHFVTDRNDKFQTEFECCSICETLHIKLPNTVIPAKMCCKPEMALKHGPFALTFAQNKNTKEIEPKLIHPLDVVFDFIAPAEMNDDQNRKWNNVITPHLGAGAYAYIFIGGAFAQIIICILVGIFWHITKERIVLECVPDCDYQFEQTVKKFNPSKSAMMSENMNSDLMSMSQAAM